MSLAVGGDFERTGGLLADALIGAGLRDGMRLLDLGCGSGRVASALAERVRIDYLGVDVVAELLDYARARAPAHYRFRLNTTLDLPAEAGAFNMGCAFSVFTHLQHEESYAYLEAFRRVLRPEGRLLFTFLEFAREDHWPVFSDTVGAVREHRRGHLNVFIERPVVALWAQRAGFRVERITPERPDVGGPGQSLAVLSRA